MESSHSQMFFKIGVLTVLQIHNNKNTYVVVSFDKVAGLKVWNFIKNRLQHRRFPVKFVKFLRTPFFTEHLWWLLLALWTVIYKFKYQLSPSMV